MLKLYVATCAIIVTLFLTVGDALAQVPNVSILIVRHPEADPTQPTIPLSAQGMARAELLIHTLSGVTFTHFFSSHTTRSRQAIEKIAAGAKLPVVQLPQAVRDAKR